MLPQPSGYPERHAHACIRRRMPFLGDLCMLGILQIHSFKAISCEHYPAGFHVNVSLLGSPSQRYGCADCMHPTVHFREILAAASTSHLPPDANAKVVFRSFSCLNFPFASRCKCQGGLRIIQCRPSEHAGMAGRMCCGGQSGSCQPNLPRSTLERSLSLWRPRCGIQPCSTRALATSLGRPSSPSPPFHISLSGGSLIPSHFDCWMPVTMNLQMCACLQPILSTSAQCKIKIRATRDTLRMKTKRADKVYILVVCKTCFELLLMRII